MKSIVDYLANAAVSALVGLMVSVAIVVARGDAALPLDFAAACSLTGAVCGTASKGIIESAFFLFGRRPAMAYLLNAVVISLIVLGFIAIYFGDLSGLDLTILVLGFAGPIVGGSLIIHRAQFDAERMTDAFERKRRRLERDEA